eukprot:TRINITY_DN54793_c0_g1_i1.p1 TRINITY_DN54793_c0_g1~~TRINITY_DN54793_c0_g1_i1.p1  ORF type:complete len:178 (-),score=18.99 TRINITY_DN54793_c0_g1_i1:64-573(-)
MPLASNSSGFSQLPSFSGNPYSPKGTLSPFSAPRALGCQAIGSSSSLLGANQISRNQVAIDLPQQTAWSGFATQQGQSSGMISSAELPAGQTPQPVLRSAFQCQMTAYDYSANSRQPSQHQASSSIFPLYDQSLAGSNRVLGSHAPSTGYNQAVRSTSFDEYCYRSEGH